MMSINSAGTVDREYPVQDSLFFKIQGNDETVKATAKLIKSIVKRHASSAFQFAASDTEADALWDARKYALMSVIASEEGARAWTTDVWLVFFFSFFSVSYSARFLMIHICRVFFCETVYRSLSYLSLYKRQNKTWQITI